MQADKNIFFRGFFLLVFTFVYSLWIFTAIQNESKAMQTIYYSNESCSSHVDLLAKKPMFEWKTVK